MFFSFYPVWTPCPCGIFLIKIFFVYLRKNNKIMITLNETTINTEWVKFCDKFTETGLSEHYDMDKLKDEITTSPCTTNDDSGVAYKGALLLHINMVMALAQRIAKMISGTFKIDENSLNKVSLIMHLSKRNMFEESTNDWEIKRGYPFKFKELGCVLKTGDRSALEALNNGVKLTAEEFEAIKACDDPDPSKRTFQGIMSTIMIQANDLAYTIERERYKKLKQA